MVVMWVKIIMCIRFYHNTVQIVIQSYLYTYVYIIHISTPKESFFTVSSIEKRAIYKYSVYNNHWCSSIVHTSAPDLSKPAGNEVHVSVCTDTEYEKRDGANHFGLKCQAVGYEWTSNPAEVKESLVNKASALMYVLLENVFKISANLFTQNIC